MNEERIIERAYPEWINAQERKPAIGERVLVERKTIFWNEYYCDIAIWDGAMWRSSDGGMNLTVRGWIKLPMVD